MKTMLLWSFIIFAFIDQRSFAINDGSQGPSGSEQVNATPEARPKVAETMGETSEESSWKAPVPYAEECKKLSLGTTFRKIEDPEAKALQEKIRDYRKKIGVICAMNKPKFGAEVGSEIYREVRELGRLLLDSYYKSFELVFEEEVPFSIFSDYIPFIILWDEDTVIVRPDIELLASLVPEDSDLWRWEKISRLISDEDNGQGNWTFRHSHMFFLCEDISGFNWIEAYKRIYSTPEFNDPYFKGAVTEYKRMMEEPFSSEGGKVLCVCDSVEAAIQTAEDLKNFLYHDANENDAVKNLETFIEKSKNGVPVREKYPDQVEIEIPSDLIILRSSNQNECRVRG